MEVLSAQCSNASTWSIHGLYGGRGALGVLILVSLYNRVLVSRRRVGTLMSRYYFLARTNFQAFTVAATNLELKVYARKILL